MNTTIGNNVVVSVGAIKHDKLLPSLFSRQLFFTCYANAVNWTYNLLINFFCSQIYAIQFALKHFFAHFLSFEEFSKVASRLVCDWSLLRLEFEVRITFCWSFLYIWLKYFSKINQSLKQSLPLNFQTLPTCGFGWSLSDDCYVTGWWKT